MRKSTVAGEGGPTSVLDLPYEEVKDESKLIGLLHDYCAEYNETCTASSSSSKEGAVDSTGRGSQNRQPMELVFFRDAVAHVCRIARVLSQPRGAMLLVGLSGSGRQSLTRLACAVYEGAGVIPYELEAKRGYGLTDFREDLQNVLRLAALPPPNEAGAAIETESAEGGEGEGGECAEGGEDGAAATAAVEADNPGAQTGSQAAGSVADSVESRCGRTTCLLLSDAQLTHETFLEDLNTLLNTGEVPDLFPTEQQDDIVDAIRKSVGDSTLTQLLDREGSGKEAVWRGVFVKQVRRNLRIVLALSPVGSRLRLRLRNFPALVNC